MGWQQITLSGHRLTDGSLGAVQGTVAAALRGCRNPKTAAILVQYPTADGSAALFVSPDAAPVVASLLSRFGPVACPEPSAEILGLWAGDREALRLLGRPATTVEAFCWR